LLEEMSLNAIGSGLVHLAHNQAADGSWGTGVWQGTVGVTSLGGLAFLAGGHQPGRGKLGQALSKALDYVLKQEDPGRPGYFHSARVLHGPMYEHAFAVQFLGEALARMDDREKKDLVRKALERSVKLILDAQNEQGGWRYHPRPLEADISVTCCQVYALMAAR